MEKTIEGNKLIAEFMGGISFSNGYDFIVRPLDNVLQRIYHLDDLKYHTSWDWLHPVVTKIKDYVLIENPYEGLLDKIDVLNLYITAPINTVWEQCVYAIKFINSQSK